MEIVQQVVELLLQAVPTAFIVLLFYVFLRANFFRPLERVIAERRGRTEGARRAAETSQAATQEKARAYLEALKTARAEIYAEQETARRAALEERAAQIRAAHTRATEEIRAAKARISDDLSVARADLEKMSETLAGEVVRAILGRQELPQATSEAR